MARQGKLALWLAAFASLLLTGSVATAQLADPADDAAAPASPAAAATELADQWGMFVHGINIGRADVARSYAEAVLASGAQPREIYALARNTADWQRLLNRGEKLEGMKDLVGRIREMVEQGYEAERSDPKEIAEAIAMLEGGEQAYAIATSRLVEMSGELAAPQLVQKLMDPQTSQVLKERVVNVLQNMGKEAVRPLSVALESKDPAVQIILANVLGQIGYPAAAPALKALACDKDTLDNVRQIAERALVAVAGKAALQKPLAELYYQLAESYYDRAESLLPDLRYDMANVWYWKEGLGLDYKPVPRQIFMEIYAMRNARLALQADPSFYPAVSLWVAADIRKAAQTPQGAADPTMAQDQPPAEFYALAAPASQLQDVLARALKDCNSAVAMGAIEALGRTAGAKNLARPVEGGVSPLVKAMEFPDRNVRFFAALTLANALPDERFEGSALVMAMLNDAIRQRGTKTALVVMSGDTLNVVKDAVRAAGFEVIEASELVGAMSAARASAGIDVVVAHSDPAPVDVLRALRSEEIFAATPLVVVGGRHTALVEADKRVIVAPEATTQAISEAIALAVAAAVGEPLSPEQAADWAVRSAQAIEKLGLTRNPVYDISRAIPALTTALDDERAEVQVAAAKALAVMPQAQAQQAIACLAVSPKADEKVRIGAFNALSDSLRVFGNQLAEQTAAAVLEVVKSKSSFDLRTAAAQALGAMNLPSAKIQSLIVETTGQ